MIYASIPRKPTLCLDFDGVIHSYTSGWEGATKISDPPTTGALAFLLQAVRFFDVCIFSSRSNAPGGIDAMKRYCVENFGQDLTNQLQFPREKPSASVSLDDRGLNFAGVWPSLETLLNFKSWTELVA